MYSKIEYTGTPRLRVNSVLNGGRYYANIEPYDASEDMTIENLNILDFSTFMSNGYASTEWVNIKQGFQMSTKITQSSPIHLQTDAGTTQPTTCASLIGKRFSCTGYLRCDPNIGSNKFYYYHSDDGIEWEIVVIKNIEDVLPTYLADTHVAKTEIVLCDRDATPFSVQLPTFVAKVTVYYNGNFSNANRVIIEPSIRPKGNGYFDYCLTIIAVLDENQLSTNMAENKVDFNYPRQTLKPYDYCSNTSIDRRLTDIETILGNTNVASRFIAR